jgi:ribosomal protein L7Ae-like RNA K-turn-binding protein
MENKNKKIHKKHTKTVIKQTIVRGLKKSTKYIRNDNMKNISPSLQSNQRINSLIQKLTELTKEGISFVPATKDHSAEIIFSPELERKIKEEIKLSDLLL